MARDAARCRAEPAQAQLLGTRSFLVNSAAKAGLDLRGPLACLLQIAVVDDQHLVLPLSCT
jgi:hypothetical protein